MPFYLYEKDNINGEEHLELQKSISLAGYNILYNLWIKQGKPLNKGWHADIGDLIQEATEKKGSLDTNTIIFDITPNRKNEINLLELLDIWAYTYEDNNKANWTPLMLRMRNAFYYWSDELMTQEEHTDKIKRFSPEYGEDIFEFLYLKGDEGFWNWGRVGNVNAPLLDKTARKFFKKFFI